VEKQLLRFLNDQRFRWVSSLILLVGFFIGSLQDVNYEFSIAVLEGMFPAFIYSIILLGLHGKLLGINIAHKNKFKWAVIILAYIIFVGWSIQSEMPFVLKLLVILIATYRFVVAINS